jgi:penicillin-binding protein A
MRKLERRSWICMALALVLFGGIVLFTVRFVKDGGEWASFYGNTQIYTDGQINRGQIYDRNGVLLLDCSTDGITYNGDSTIRKATVHAVGDTHGNVASGAINMWKDQLIGYDILNGTYDTTSEGKSLTLTISAEANRVAYNALGSRNGTVGVYNYETGEILCMVSKPSFDPADDSGTDSSSSIYFNTFLLGTVTPGSTFKTVTAGAAYEKISDIEDFDFTCDGVNEYEGEKITCSYTHGNVNFETAMAKSCNGAFGELAREVGAGTLERYVKSVGLTKSLNVNGIKTAKGTFVFPDDNEIGLSWAGIGQYQDSVNPCSMMVYMGAIANGGEAISPTLIKNSNFLKNLTGGKSLGKYLSSDTAAKLSEMMKYNVQTTYGESNYSGLDIYAKSGTAEVGTSSSNSLFVGFINNPGHPYAFFVWVEGGSSGASVAGPVARAVLNELISE